jgi:hypothetical protein
LNSERHKIKKNNEGAALVSRFSRNQDREWDITFMLSFFHKRRSEYFSVNPYSVLYHNLYFDFRESQSSFGAISVSREEYLEKRIERISSREKIDPTEVRVFFKMKEWKLKSRGEKRRQK